jgi:hypothetical protein
MSTVADRLAPKTPEARFLNVLESEFDLLYREAREVACEAREALGLDRPTDQVRTSTADFILLKLPVVGVNRLAARMKP